MDPSSSYNAHEVESLEHRALAALLDAFHPGISLQEIASAYCEAGNDITKASEILCQRQDNDYNTAISERDSATNSAMSEKLLHQDSAELSTLNIKGSKPKKLSASVGSVSGFLGKSYSRPTSSKKELLEPTKPLKLEVSGSLVNDFDVEPPISDSVHGKQELCDMEDFLFAMLGDGFQLSRDVIRDVLGDCGYDMKKGMEELLILSAKTVANGKSIVSGTAETCTGSLPMSQSCFPEDSLQRCLTKRSAPENERSNLSREVMLSLFNAPDRYEEPKKRLPSGLNRTRVPGKSAVTKPPPDLAFLPLTNFGIVQSDVEHVVDEDDDYQTLRRVAKEHWENMKASYKAAIDAFADDDHSKANILLEEGRNHKQRAREAEERSALLILETRKSEEQSDVPLDLHTHSAKEAVRMLKKHLHMLADLPMFRYLKVIVNTDMEDVTKGKRKRLIIKLLERESIKWTEDENPGTIIVELKEIDPNKLSFGNDLP